MSEQEIRMTIHNDGNDGDSDSATPNLERLANMRSQAESFNDVIARICAYTERTGHSSRNIVDAIRNTSGE